MAMADENEIAVNEAVVVSTLCFVGGCMDCVGYLLLFHSLIGAMTINTMVGIIGLFDDGSRRDAILHFGTVAGFLIMVTTHRLASGRKQDSARFHPVRSLLMLEFGVLLVFALLGSFTLHHGSLRQPNVAAFALVCLGSFGLYLQSMVAIPGRRFNTPTYLMTGNYVALITHSVNALRKAGGVVQSQGAVLHFTCVHLSFWSGVVLMASLVPHVDFLALGLPLVTLGTLILLLRRYD